MLVTTPFRAFSNSRDLDRGPSSPFFYPSELELTYVD